MLYIGICDDEKYFLSEEKEIIIKYMKKRDCPCQIDTFDSGTTFIDSGANVPYDILFLDIDLGDVKGFEIGKQIRDELKNNKIQIVYISGDTSYAMELFKTRPFDFVVKPVDKKSFLRC